MIQIRADQKELLRDLPCGDTILKGIEDIHNEVISIESCLAAIASPRLVSAGLLEKIITLGSIDSEHTLYSLLASHGEQTHSAYNARLQELVSFENALDHRLRWDQKQIA